MRDTCALPESAGATVFTGAGNAATAVVDADHFVTDDTVFVAVTEATMNRAASAVTRVYVALVWPPISVHAAGFAFAAT
jgi:hypothetical protein